jgi:sigma-B regulation protein RsbU (phosphoserine phosphatase)
MAQTISLLRIFSRGAESPAEVLAALNKELSQILEGRFVTAQYAVIDLSRRTLRGACAGHPPFFYYDKAGREVSEKLGASGPPLGLVPGASYTIEEWPVGPGDKIFLYTDGWTEARSRRGEEFGSARLKELFSKHRDLPAGELLEALRREQEGFERGAPAHDDATAVLLEF